MGEATFPLDPLCSTSLSLISPHPVLLDDDLNYSSGRPADLRSGSGSALDFFTALSPRCLRTSHMREIVGE